MWLRMEYIENSIYKIYTFINMHSFQQLTSVIMSSESMCPQLHYINLLKKDMHIFKKSSFIVYDEKR